MKNEIYFNNKMKLWSSRYYKGGWLWFSKATCKRKWLKYSYQLSKIVSKNMVADLSNKCYVCNSTDIYTRRTLKVARTKSKFVVGWCRLHYIKEYEKQI